MTNNELIERLQASKQFQNTGDEDVCISIDGAVLRVTDVHFIGRVLTIHAKKTPFSISEAPK